MIRDSTDRPLYDSSSAFLPLYLLFVVCCFWKTLHRQART